MQLEFYEDFEYRDLVLERLYKEFGRDNRTGMHVTDIVYCLIKAYGRKQPDYVNDVKSDSILYFVRGRSLGDLLEKLFDEREKKVQHEGVVGHIDAVDEEHDCVVEIKTAKSIWNDIPSEGYQTQLRYYMAMYNVQVGYLLYYIITTNQLRAFKFIATKKQLADTLKEIEARKKLLELALDTKDWTLLPPSKSSFECRVCEILWCPNNTNPKYKSGGENNE